MRVKLSDPYGIPPNMFGSVPEEFFGALGRVVMVAALLELRLLDLVTTLDHTTQEHHAGKHGSDLIKACRAGLREQDPLLQTAAVSVLERANEELAMRNAVVHSLWPSPSITKAFGWRPVTKGKRERPGDPNVAIEVSVPELEHLVRRMVGLIEETVMITQRVEHPQAHPG